MSRTHCDSCRRQFKVKGGEPQRAYSPASGRYYCPMNDEKACKRERRKLIASGVVNLAEDNKAVTTAVRARSLL